MTMRGIDVHDTSPDGRFLAVSLSQILDAIGIKALDSSWALSSIEFTAAAGSEPLHALENTEGLMPGRRLYELSLRVIQFIDGYFRAYATDCTEPWLVIRAVDSSAYFVFSTDEAALVRVKNRFLKVRDIPGGL